jgi:large subunit ribosomal protein L3
MTQLIGKKIGMTRVFDSQGMVCPVTIIEVKGNRVVGLRTKEKNGYRAVQIGYGYSKKIKKSLLGVFKKDNIPNLIREFLINEEENYKIGDKFTVENFAKISYVDVEGRSIGKGFQGVIKRYNMAGGPKTHGSSFHRRPGSIGNSSYPGRVFKGKKMPGRMGNKKVTTQNIKVIKIDKENDLIILKGAIAGARNGIVYIKQAVKKKQ